MVVARLNELAVTAARQRWRSGADASSAARGRIAKRDPPDSLIGHGGLGGE
jgi:hypothetical protein